MLEMLQFMAAPFAACLILVGVHGYLGLHVLLRQVIFVDLALAQIAALGGTVAFLLGAQHGSGTAYLYSFGFTLLGALIFSLTRLEDSPVPQEALIGITYVVASAAVILLSSFSAEGAEHLQETMSGALIWVTWPTVWKVGLSYGAVGLLHYLLRRKFLAVSFHPGRISHVRFWDFVFYATFGTVITSSVQIAGVLMVFSVLVIPAVVAFFYARTFHRALLVAWGTGAVAILAGLGTSFALDLTTGPVIVCAFGVLLLVALLFRRRFGVVLAEGDRRGLVVKSFSEA